MSDNELEEDSAAMAAMMGFSGFGNQVAHSKKRKFNAATDAYVEGAELENIDRGGKKGQGSGGNQVPLGKMRVLGVKGDEVGEIDLEDHEDDGEGDEGPRYLDTSAPPPLFDGVEDGEYAVGLDGIVDDPTIIEERRIAQEQIDAILAAAPSPAPSENTSSTQAAAPLHGLPERPVHTHISQTNMSHTSSGRINRVSKNTGSDMGSTAGSRAGGRGMVNKKWYEGYYDRSFNENPWARLEGERGLEGRGSWV